MSETNYWSRMRRRRLSRRTLLGASARAGVGAAGLALVGCGDDDDDDQAVAQSTSTPQPQQQQATPAQTQQQQADQQATDAAQQEGDDDGQQTTATPAAEPAGGAKMGGTWNTTYVGTSSANPPTLDPMSNLTYLAQIPSGYHYSRLLKYIRGGPGVDPLNYGEYEGDAAAGLPEIPDATTYIYTIRDNMYWHDVDPLNGRQLTVDDIVYTQDRFLSKKEQNGNAQSWDGVVANFEAVADQQIRITLEQPYAPFLNFSASPSHLWIIPREITEDGDNTVEQRPVGSGAWIFDEYSPDVRITWRRNPNWYEPEWNGLKAPFADGISASLVGDPNVIIPNLAEGNLDLSLLAPSIYDRLLAEVPDANYRFNQSTVPNGFAFDYRIEPFNDPRIRQGLSLSLDRQAILEAEDNTKQGAWQTCLSPLAPFYMDPRDQETFGENVEYFHRDIARAKQLFDAAGYPADDDGVHIRDVQVLGNRDRYGAPWANYMETVMLSAAEAGITYQFQFKEYAAYIASWFRGEIMEDHEFGILLGPFIVPVEPDDILFTVYHPDSGRHNWGAGPGDPSEDATFVKMLNDQRAETDAEARLQLVQDIQRYCAEKMYIIPTPRGASVYGFNPNVRHQDFDNIWHKAGYGWGTEFMPYLWKTDA